MKLSQLGHMAEINALSPHLKALEKICLTEWMAGIY